MLMNVVMLDKMAVIQCTIPTGLFREVFDLHSFLLSLLQFFLQVV
jgi:hypothetical protein